MAESVVIRLAPQPILSPPLSSPWISGGAEAASPCAQRELPSGSCVRKRGRRAGVHALLGVELGPDLTAPTAMRVGSWPLGIGRWGAGVPAAPGAPLPAVELSLQSCWAPRCLPRLQRSLSSRGWGCSRSLGDPVPCPAEKVPVLDLDPHPQFCKRELRLGPPAASEGVKADPRAARAAAAQVGADRASGLSQPSGPHPSMPRWGQGCLVGGHRGDCQVWLPVSAVCVRLASVWTAPLRPCWQDTARAAPGPGGGGWRRDGWEQCSRWLRCCGQW